MTTRYSPPSPTSQASPLQRSLRAGLVATLLISLAGGAWPWRPRVEEPEPVIPALTQEEPPPPPPTFDGEVFAGGLPLDTGPLPAGLANLSAQGCAACHVQAHTSWQSSPHATSLAPTQRLPEAAAVCDSCHRPLLVQWPALIALDGGRVEQPIATPNEHFDATLSLEGVTCAACHVRDGVVLTSRVVTDAPHPTRVAPDLRESTACAPCHQLSWPGASAPLYDTYGEWQRSAQAAAGIRCQDCHLRPGADTGAASHDVQVPASRAVSLLVRFPPRTLHRGDAPLPVAITLQNTGAGHAFPTGSPYRAVLVEAALVQGAEQVVVGDTFVQRLGRTLTDAPPWSPLTDTRLPAGGVLEWTWEAALSVDAPSGATSLRVRLVEESPAPGEQGVLVTQLFPLDVD